MDMAWNNLPAAGTKRDTGGRGWRRLIESFEGFWGVAVPGGGEHMGMRARMPYETGDWFVVTNRSNAFNATKPTAVPVLAEVANCEPALTLLAAN